MIQPTDFINQAEKLVNPTNSPLEIDCRSAISRAYYFLYHESFRHLKITHDRIIVQTIQEYLKRRQPPVSYDPAKLNRLDDKYLKDLQINLHGTIPNVLRRLGFYEYGNDFDSFREDRNMADYDLAENFLLDDSSTKIKEMKNLARSITVIP